MTTSGSSGRKGLYVYDRPGWVAIGASFMRFSAWAGTRPKLPRRRMAMVAGGSPTHMSRRGSAMLSIGLHRMLALPVTTPVPRMVEALNAFEPDCLHVYPSMAVLLADEKRAGRLRAAPAVITTSSELCTPEMADGDRGRVRRAPARPVRLHRGPVGRGVRRGRGPPPVRGPRDRRERRRGRPPGARRRARRARAGHEPLQLRAAADPLRGLRRRHDRPGAVPVRAHAAPDALGRRPRRRRAPAARPPAARACPCTRCSSA